VKLQGQPGKSRFESEKIWEIFGANGARQFKPIKTASPTRRDREQVYRKAAERLK